MYKTDKYGIYTLLYADVAFDRNARVHITTEVKNRVKGMENLLKEEKHNR